MQMVLSRKNFVAHTGTFFWWKRIFLGSQYFNLSNAHRLAVKAHELGHMQGHHTEWRILTLIFCPFIFFWICRQQEFLADEYAAEQGCSHELIEFLIDNPCSGRMYPSNFERIERLIRLAPVKGHFAR
jgi:Zn-dependent protease with chaperone function